MNGQVQDDALAAFLADRFRLVSLELQPIAVRCAWPVYKGMAYGRPPMFIKLTSRLAAERTMEFLETVSAPFLPRPMLDEAPDFEGLSVLVLEWKETTQINAEDMTDAQVAGFLDGCRQLAKILSDYHGPVAPPDEEDSPRSQYEKLVRFDLRHPLTGRLLKPLLAIPEVERSYGDHPLVTIHGDLQPKNYGFDGNRIAAVYDTDDLTEGLACEDAAYAFTERARRTELSAAKRRCLTEHFLCMVKASSWPKDEWLIAVNHARLRIAARRLESHPDSAFIAFDIARRDKPLRLLAEALKEASC